MTIKDKLFAALVFISAIDRPEVELLSALRRLADRCDRGDADSAGSTLRTIMVVFLIYGNAPMHPTANRTLRAPRGAA